MLDGHRLYAYLPGGASGGILPAGLADIPLDFDTLQPHGCFIGRPPSSMLSQHDRARDAARNAMRFRRRSCGQCTPCRVGTAKAASLMQKRRSGMKSCWTTWRTVMADASICGLGPGRANPSAACSVVFPHGVGGPWRLPNERR